MKMTLAWQVTRMDPVQWSQYLYLWINRQLLCQKQPAILEAKQRLKGHNFYTELSNILFVSFIQGLFKFIFKSVQYNYKLKSMSFLLGYSMIQMFNQFVMTISFGISDILEAPLLTINQIYFSAVYCSTAVDTAVKIFPSLTKSQTFLIF